MNVTNGTYEATNLLAEWWEGEEPSFKVNDVVTIIETNEDGIIKRVFKDLEECLVRHKDVRNSNEIETYYTHSFFRFDELRK
ncbi:hypothetical protein [Aneurinibacillus aneurinilyticus]|uniref:Uncharacterized protein n=1 Tax=Aneurinibacillus aneurinilyticus ATCC 12856 TaxID=649747 RepID=U1WQI7_ANEAE|nr:hypothetical protein [Aneurinibacillus aneurinilyticus]ERI10854.1 hypothetical protein HMPREF0083_01042 [Aneurinibacillus aneurinilyticus ATCC 12856]MED0704912.1 hypothetical protein [Aneurinibacillus aneurinilyticus]MED0724046.1 hypothetical protein [Aneurinibacillus aneurinilyticus]MED0731957.1 hypothetical protein [Aneurinibacillus aneurinilyticus]MED0741513.1 hypothetical protein [Aneurinibacillus aneurinilyticus]